MKYYLAYGSNMNTYQMACRCPDARIVGSTWLEDYELFFAGRGSNAVASIRPKKGSRVPVLIWTISAADERSLDRYEGYPTFYGKETLTVTVDGNELEAMAYIMTPRPASRKGTPSEYYLEVIAEGYEEFGFDVTPLRAAASSSQTAIERLAIAQRAGYSRTCPRCGGKLKDRLGTNALSRRADVYVCDDCGIAEAIADFNQEDDPLESWSCFS